jgi:hypothetical protein
MPAVIVTGLQEFNPCRASPKQLYATELPFQILLGQRTNELEHYCLASRRIEAISEATIL